MRDRNIALSSLETIPVLHLLMVICMSHVAAPASPTISSLRLLLRYGHLTTPSPFQCVLMEERAPVKHDVRGRTVRKTVTCGPHVRNQWINVQPIRGTKERKRMQKEKMGDSYTVNHKGGRESRRHFCSTSCNSFNVPVFSLFVLEHAGTKLLED